jgi:hypothetical protein
MIGLLRNTLEGSNDLKICDSDWTITPQLWDTVQVGASRITSNLYIEDSLSRNTSCPGFCFPQSLQANAGICVPFRTVDTQTNPDTVPFCMLPPSHCIHKNLIYCQLGFDSNVSDGKNMALLTGLNYLLSSGD